MQKHATQDSVTLLYKLTIFRIILEAISIYFANWTTTDLLADYYGGWRGGVEGEEEIASAATTHDRK